MAQLVAQLAFNQTVSGSIPDDPTKGNYKMKLQTCKFQRVKTVEKLRAKGAKLKSDYASAWETGVARLQSFNDGSIEWIMDESGEKVPWEDMYKWDLISNLGYSAIDTKL